MNKKADMDDIFIIFLIIMIVVLFVGSLIFFLNIMLEKECKMQSDIMGVEWKYNFWIDCMIKVDDKWINMDNYIINEEKN